MDHKQLTSYQKEQLRCPKCGKEHTLPKYSVINVTEKPELKEKVLKNEMFIFQCDNCNLTAPLTYDSIYIDRNRKLVIGMSPDANEDWKKGLAEWNQKGYSMRIVDNINDMKEKIMIFDNMLDDRVIELAKITYLKQLEKEMAGDTLLDILFDYSGSQMYFIVFFEKKGVGRIPFNIEYYRGIEQTYGAAIRAKKLTDFEKIDMEWAGNIMFQRN